MATTSPGVVDSLRSFLSRQRVRSGADGELLRCFAALHDEESFATLLQRHGPMVLGLARRVVGDGQLAEDVFQAAFLLLARRAHTIRRPESLASWLHRVTFRLALRARRCHQRSQERQQHARPALPRTPLEELTAGELVSILDEELHRLPEPNRAAVILCCLEGLSQEEAARQLSCSADAVRGRLERGRKQLRLKLEKRGLTVPAVLGSSLLLLEPVAAVPPTLTHATPQAARAGMAMSSGAALLLKGALRSAFLSRLKLVSAAIMLLTVTVGGLGMALRSHAGNETDTPPSKPLERASGPGTVPSRTDRQGDPLPDGAIARLGTLRLRASGAQVSLSADGKTIITLRGEQVTYWDADTGNLRQQRRLPLGGSSAVCLSSDGRRLATRESNPEKPIDVWDVETGKRLHQLSAAQRIFRAAFSPRAKMLALVPYSTNEAVVSLWDLESGQQRELKGAGSPPENLAFSPDGKLLAAASGQFVICWDTVEGKELWRAKGGHNVCLAFTPDGRTLLGSRAVFQRDWHAWDATTGKPSDQLQLPSASLCGQMSVAPDGRTLVFAPPLFVDGADTRVHLWDLRSGKLLHRLDTRGPIGPFAPDGQSVLTSDGVVQRWQLATGRPLLPDTRELGHAGEVVRVLYSPDGRRMASSARDGVIRLWDLATARPLRVLRGHEREADGLAFTPDGKYLVSGGVEGELIVWDTEVGKEARRIPLHDPKRGEKKQHVWRLHVTPDGRRVVVLGYGQDAVVTSQGIVTTLELATGRRTARAEVTPCSGYYTAFSPDGQLLASQGELIETATGQSWAKLENKEGGSDRYAFSSDGRLVAGRLYRMMMPGMPGMSRVTPKESIQVWESISGRALRRISTDWAGQVAFSPDGRYLVAADIEGLRLWELATGQVVLRHRAHERVSGSYGYSFASCLSFAPDGRTVATGHPDSTVLIWNMTPPGPALELPRLWEELASPEASRAYAASWRLTDSPRETLLLLRQHLQRATPAPAEQTRQLLADLDSEEFARREAASARLAQLGDRVGSALREALEAGPALEKRRRLEKLLKLLETSPTLQMLRELWAVTVLERIGTEEAHKLLAELARGDLEARQTREAKASLERLSKRRSR